MRVFRAKTVKNLLFRWNKCASKIVFCDRTWHGLWELMFLDSRALICDGNSGFDR